MLLLCGLFVGTASNAQAVFLEVGSEFQVNSYTTAGQFSADVACAADGGCVVVWSGNGAPLGVEGVYAKRLDPQGVVLGTEFNVGLTPGFSFTEPRVCGHESGEFVVTWQDGDDILVRRYDAQGGAVTTASIANSYTTGPQGMPDIACGDDGGFIITWTDLGAGASGQDGDGFGIFGRRFDATGVPAGTDFLVNSDTQGEQAYASVDTFGDGSFVVVWEELSSFGYGVLGGEFIRGRRFDAAGVSQGDQFYVSGGADTYLTNSFAALPDVATHDDGFVVVWTQGGSSCSAGYTYCTSELGDVAARRFDASGQPLGVGLVVGNTESSGQSNADGDTGPRLAVQPAGEFIVVWNVSDGTLVGGPRLKVALQRVDSSGSPLGSSQVVNSAVGGGQSQPSIARSGIDTHTVVWSTGGQDGDGGGIAARRYCEDPAGDIDGDGVCASLDNCVAVANPAQADSDGDGVGDVCDRCAGSDDSLDTDADGLPDGCDRCGNPGGVSTLSIKPRVRLQRIAADPIVGDDRLKISGRFLSSIPLTAVRPDLHGARVVLASGDGIVRVDVVLPAGLFTESGIAGWKTNSKGNRWTFKDKSGASVGGITSLSIKQSANTPLSTNKLKVKGKNGDYPVLTTDAPLVVSIDVGDPDVGAGACTELAFDFGTCRVSGKDTKLSCRQ